MEKSKKITIELKPREGKKIPFFNLDAKNMERYEVIGILEIAIHHLKLDCEKDTKKINS